MIQTKSNFKGFVFTLDAIFALIVAVASISILMYVHFSSTLLYTAPAAEASSILQNLMQTTVYSASLGNVYASYLLNSWQGNTYTWPQFGHDQYHSSNNSYGPQTASLLYTFSAPYPIVPSVAVDQGVVAFGAGTYLYALNATTGAPLNTYPLINVGAVQVTPLIYKNEIIYTCPIGCIIAESISNSLLQLWSTELSTDVSTPLQIEDGYLVAGTSNSIYLLYPQNGTTAASVTVPAASTVQPPVYINGEFIVTTGKPGVQNYIYAYVLTGGTLTNVWSYPLKIAQTTQPVVNGSVIAVGSGSSLYTFNLDGTLIKQNVLPNAQIVGLASSTNNFYVETVNAIYRFSPSGSTIFSYPTITDNQNSTPSVSPPILYTLVSGTNYQGYNIQAGTNIWNVSLPYASAYTGYSAVALAYGNAYVVNGNTLYVFGTPEAQPSDSLLQTVTRMYLNNESAYSNLMLNKIYNSSNVGLFINGTYAPTLKTASFNGANSHINIGKINQETSNNPISFTVWFYTASLTSSYPMPFGDTINSPRDGYDLFISGPGSGSNGIVGAERFWGTAGCLSCGIGIGTPSPISMNTIYFATLTYDGSTFKFYLNGALVGSFATTNSITPDSIMSIGAASGYGYIWDGSISNVQIYNIALSSSQVAQLYQSGQYGMPVSMQNLIGWWPLEGDTNDYSGYNNVGIPTSVTFQSSNALPASLKNAFQISKATTPLSITSNGVNKLYNVSVVSWR